MSMLSAVSIYSIIVPFIIGIGLYNKLSKDAIKIWLLTCIGTLPQLLKYFLSNKEYVDIAYNIYLAGEFTIMFSLFREKFLYKKSKTVFIIISCIYLILVAAIIEHFGITHRFLYEWICLSSLVYTIWIIIIVLEQYQNENIEMEVKIRSAFFWYIMGMFIYSLCTILIFAFWDFIKSSSKNTSTLLKGIHSIFNINLYLCISIGLCLESISIKKQFGK